MSADPDAAGARRVPEQDRSRQRVEQILDAAITCIAAEGVDAMTMSGLATAADVSLPSIYRYFPSKQAIVRVLVERYAVVVRQRLTDALGDGVEGPDDARAAVARALDAYWALYRQDDAFAAVWGAAVADPALAQLDIDDSRTNGHLLAQALVSVVPQVAPADLERRAFLASHLAGAAVRLAIQLPEVEGDAVIADVLDRVVGPLLGLPAPR